MIKRIKLSLLRRKSNIYILLLLFLTTTLSFACVLIYHTADKNIEELENTYAVSFSIMVDRTAIPNIESYWEEHAFGDGYSVRVFTGPGVTYEMMEQICQEVDGIKEYEADNEWGILLQDYKLIEGYNYYSYLTNDQLIKDHPNSGLLPTEDIYSVIYMTKLLATHNSQYFEKFYDGSFKLTQGSHIEPGQQHVAIISEELAELNNLKIGDSLQIDACSFNSISGYPAFSFGAVEVEIIGMFQTTYQQPINQLTDEQDILNNWVLTDDTTSIDMGELCGYDGHRVVDRYFFVNNPEELDEVMEQVRQLGWINWDYYYLEKNDDSYANAIAPLKTIKMVMTAAIWIITLSSIALFYFVLLHSVKGREHEAGILLALGVPAKEIRKQIRYEMIILGIVAYILSLGISSIIAPIVGNQLLDTFKGEEQKVYTDEELEAMIRSGQREQAAEAAANQREGVAVQETLEIENDPIYAGLMAVIEIVIILFCVQLALDQTLKWEPSRVLALVS